MKSPMKKIAMMGVSALLALLVWYGFTHPRAIVADWKGPLKSASFAPFSDGQSPLKEVFPKPEQIESDLVRLKGIFEGVRTYTALGGMEVVPALAAKHGFTLTHSAWLGRGAEGNDKEVAALIDTANRYPQAVKRVIVGNEVLLRRDLKPDELIAYIDRVRGAIQQPVSYADVWAFWLKNPQVAEHVDYITIHILPYWEDEPVSAEDAEKHLLDIIQRIKTAFPGKPILVGETGWPTEGRSRGPAGANLMTAAQYVRRLPVLAEQYGFDYNLVEAYDQSWKAQLEGTVGARWGVFDANRKLKFSFSGDVSPIDNAMPRIAVSVVFGVVVSLLLVPFFRTTAGALLAGLWSQAFAASVVQSLYMALRLTVSPASFTWAEQHLLFFMADQHWLSDTGVAFWYKLLLQTLAEPIAHAWGYAIAACALIFSASVLLWLRRLLKDEVPGKAACVARSGFGLYVLASLVFAVMFSTSGRYIDIPLPHYWLPLCSGLALLGLQALHGRKMSRDYAVFTRCDVLNLHILWLAPLAAVACIWGEVGAMMGGEDFIAMHPALSQRIPLITKSILANHELLLWCVVCALQVLPFYFAAVRKNTEINPE
jgi:exo-beta-1,3-glucanase (GH17 family)